MLQSLRHSGDRIFLDQARQESAEMDGQVARLRKQADEYENQRAQLQREIDASKAACEEMRRFTVADVFRLRGESEVGPTWG